MPRYALGTTVRVGQPPLQVRDSTGTLVDASAISLSLQKPDGTTQNYPTLTHDDIGLYHKDIPTSDLTQLGHYQWYVSATVSGFSFVLPSGTFDVFDPLETTLLSLQDAKDALNIPQTNTASDAEIMRKVGTIEAGIERVTGGPIVNRTISNERAEIVDNFTALLVRKRPLVSVTSITSTSSNTAMSLADIELDTNAGIIRRKLGWPFLGPFFTWLPIFTVTYVAGWGTSVPPAIADAATDILKHFWETERSGVSLPRFGQEDTVQLPGMNYAIPNIAAEKLAPYALEVHV